MDSNNMQALIEEIRSIREPDQDMGQSHCEYLSVLSMFHSTIDDVLSVIESHFNTEC